MSNNGDNFYTFAFPLTSSLSIIDLPLKMSNIKKMKVKSIRYITKTLGNEYLLIRVAGWDDNSSFFGQGYNKQFTRYLPLNGTLDTLNIYLNNDTQFYDCSKKTNVSNVGTLQIEATIDGEYTNDISPSNPLIVELYFTE